MRKETRIMKVEEMVPQIVERPVDVWITDDGKEFTNEALASVHEATLNQAKYKQLWEEKWSVNKLEVPFVVDELYLVSFSSAEDFLEFENAATSYSGVCEFNCMAPDAYPAKRLFYITDSGWSDFWRDDDYEEVIVATAEEIRRAANQIESFFTSSELVEYICTCPICGGTLNHEGVSYANHGTIYSAWICTKCGRTGTAVSEETIEVNFVKHEVNEEE